MTNKGGGLLIPIVATYTKERKNFMYCNLMINDFLRGDIMKSEMLESIKKVNEMTLYNYLKEDNPIVAIS